MSAKNAANPSPKHADKPYPAAASVSTANANRKNMEKPALLRAEIQKHLPELRQNPDKLTMFVTNGQIIASKGTLSHETKYRLSVMITDFTGNIDVLNAVVIAWLQEANPQIIGPGATTPTDYSFEVELLSNHACDILIELNLIERTTVLTDDQGNIVIGHPRNANHSDLMTALGIGESRK